MLPFSPEGKWRHGNRRTVFIGSGPGGRRTGLASPCLNSDKRPPGKLQFHQFHRSFRILAFVINAAAVAVAKKRRRKFSYDEALSVV